MPRRRKSSDGELARIAKEFEHLPVRAGILTAGVLVLAGALLPLLFPEPARSILGSLALIGRYVLWFLAFLIIIASLTGGARRWMERRRFDSDIDVADLSWGDFEGYLAEYFRRRGSAVRSRGGSHADGGVDLILDDLEGRRIVQAKHWKARSVGVVPLRALWGVLGDEGAQGAVFVTSGTFTPDALAFAGGKRLELIDGERLRKMIAEVKASAPVFGDASQAVESCPQCGRGTLQRRLARRGKNAGSHFLGCSRFPDCRYARNLAAD